MSTASDKINTHHIIQRLQHSVDKECNPYMFDITDSSIRDYYITLVSEQCDLLEKGGIISSYSYDKETGIVTIDMEM